MKVSPKGLALIKQFEGFVGHQYRDSVGVRTIGYGTTEADVKPLPLFVNDQQASKLLTDHLNKKYLPYIEQLGVPLNQNQIDALASFIYNVGPGGIAPSTQVGKALRAKNYKAAADHLLDWDKAGGSRLAGLTRRRKEERDLFLTPEAGIPDPWMGYTDNEKRWIHEYDSHKTTKERRKVLSYVLTKQRKRVWQAAQKRGWDKNNYRKRYHSLLIRSRI